MHKLISLNINDEECKLSVSINETLLDVLRHKLDLTGAKEGCSQGECGACTVIIDGKAAMACLILAVSAENKKIVTIEGLAQKDLLHPLQESFVEKAAVQCGYCTPGMIMSAKALLDSEPDADKTTIIKHLSGNHCRCTGYTKIIDAVLDAQIKLKGIK
jgi:carbon-monoxide dehydrogenase small subunit